MINIIKIFIFSLSFFINYFFYYLFYIKTKIESNFLFKIKNLKMNYTILEHESKYNIYNYEKYLVLPEIIEFVCIRMTKTDYYPNIIIAVLSSPHNFKKRYSFRKLTNIFCNSNNNCKFIFLSVLLKM